MNLLDIKNQLPENVFNLLNEVYTLAGAKEIFEKHNVEVLNKEIEIEMIKKVTTETEVFLKESKEMKEFGQVKQFVDMQITSNEAMLKTAEGFMKSMIEMNIQTAKAQLDMAVKQFTAPFTEKLKELINTFVVNESNKANFLKIADTVNLLNATEVINKATEESIKEIETRYAGQETTNQTKTAQGKGSEKKSEKKEAEKAKVTSKEVIKEEIKEDQETKTGNTEDSLGDLKGLSIDGLGDLVTNGNDVLNAGSGSSAKIEIKTPGDSDQIDDLLAGLDLDLGGESLNF